MVEKCIQELCSLYTDVTQRFRSIKLEYLDEEEVLEHAVLTDIKNYLNGLLEIIPKDVEASFGGKLFIYFYKKAPYRKNGGETDWTDIVIIRDIDTYSCMVFDEKYHDLDFIGFDDKAGYLRLTTLEYMCFNWKEIKKEICKQVAGQLDYYISRRLEQVTEKKDKLQIFSEWRGV